jgi:hypothetical protein
MAPAPLRVRRARLAFRGLSRRGGGNVLGPADRGHRPVRRRDLDFGPGRDFRQDLDAARRRLREVAERLVEQPDGRLLRRNEVCRDNPAGKGKVGFGQRYLGPRVQCLINVDDIAWIERRDRSGTFVRIGTKPPGAATENIKDIDKLRTRKGIYPVAPTRLTVQLWVMVGLRTPILNCL